MDEQSGNSPLGDTRAELRRIGLDPDELTGLVVAESAAGAVLTHLRSLAPGASWSDVYPGTPAQWRPNAPRAERALGPFDYAEPPRGPAAFASLTAENPRSAASLALARVEALGVPLFGSGLVLDCGAPHLYVVLKRGTSADDVYAVVDCLRTQDGVVNCFPER